MSCLLIAWVIGHSRACAAGKNDSAHGSSVRTRGTYRRLWDHVTVRYLVTGGAGFIGSHYVRTLLGGTLTEQPVDRVTVLDKLTYAGVWANLDSVAADDRLAFVQGDILDAVVVDRLVGDTDAVVHFAAESHVDRSISGAATSS